MHIKGGTSQADVSTISIVLLAFASTLGPFATNGIVPSFIALSEVFDASMALLQTTLTVYLVAFALGSLVVGALSDTYGRCRVLAGGMILFCVATFFVTQASSLFEFNAWRFIQGLGASVGQVVTQAMVRDRFSGMLATRVMSIIGMIFAISPAFAPVIGGWCVVSYGWQAVFWFLFLYAGSIVLIALFGLQETLPVEKRKKLALKGLTENYVKCLKNKAFLFGILSNSMAMMGSLLVVAGGADFVVHVLGFGVDEFAYMSIPLVFSALIGTALAPTYVKLCGARQGIVALFGITLILEIILFFVHKGQNVSYFSLLAMPLAFQFFAAMARPAVMVMNLDYMPERRGLAASVQQCFMTGGFALSASILVPLCIGEAWKYAVGMAFAAFLSGLFWALSLRYRYRYLPKKGNDDVL